MSAPIKETLAEFEDEPYTRAQFDKDLARVLVRLCEKHGLTTRAEVHALVAEHRYTHSNEDPEEDYLQLMAVASHMGWT